MFINSRPTVLDARGLTKSYGAGTQRRTALQSVSFTLHAGELASICGPSGSGKTTLLNIIGMLDHPDSGELWIGGTRVGRLPPTERERIRQRRIGLVSQEFGLLPTLSVIENVEMALLPQHASRADRLERARLTLQSVRLDQHERHFPHTLSEGQRQRVSIARAIVRQPKIVLVDEFTANVDTETARGLIALLQDLARDQQLTFLLTTNDPRLREATTSRMSLQDGRLAAE